MRNLISALQFITILPLGKAQTFDPPKMVPYFPLVGMMLGLLVAVFDALVVRLWTSSVVALLDIILLAVLTAAFHIDDTDLAAAQVVFRESRLNLRWADQLAIIPTDLVQHRSISCARGNHVTSIR